MTTTSAARSAIGTMPVSTTHWCTATACIPTAARKATTRTWSACSSQSSYEARRAMRKSSRMFSSPVGVVVMGALLLMAASALAAAPLYEDLRHIEPVHGDAAAGAKKATLCFVCHGANGGAVDPPFPRLACQRAEYLYHRLVSFKRADPKDPYYSVSPMTPNVANLSDTDMRDLATYFSSQP